LERAITKDLSAGAVCVSARPFDLARSEKGPGTHFFRHTRRTKTKVVLQRSRRSFDDQSIAIDHGHEGQKGLYLLNSAVFLMRAKVFATEMPMPALMTFDTDATEVSLIAIVSDIKMPRLGAPKARAARPRRSDNHDHRLW
jgi:hypothetical protein